MGNTLPSGDVDFLGADRFSALGDTPVFVADVAQWQPPRVAIQAVCIGIDADGVLPAVDPAHFDVLLTTARDAPAPWVTVPPDSIGAHADDLADAVRQWPAAATILCRVLRLTEHLPFHDAIDIESLGYSTLLAGGEFDRWQLARRPSASPIAAEPLVEVARQGDRVTLTLNAPDTRNAMTAAMRDALHAALATVLDDPTAPEVLLRAAGRCFSTGGALGEFGTAKDLAQAHVIRSLRSCAALLDLLGDRAQVHLHGACVGSGLEIPAAASRRSASADAWFQLPELRMGLIPGAGGTASVARAVGRHRTAWMVLSGKRIAVRQALDWGLINEIVP